MRNKLILLLLVVAALCDGGVLRAAGTDVVAEADSAYQEGKFELAASLYEKAVVSGGYSAPILYNMGNAFFKAGNWGAAMLSYERANRLDPSNELISNNLDYLRSRVEDANKAELKGKKYKVTPDELSFFQTIHKSLAKERSSDYWAAFSAMAFVLFIAFAAIYIFVSNVAARKVGFFGGIIFAAFSLLFIIFAFMAARAARSTDEGVVTAYKVALHTEPLDNSQTVATPLTQGTVLSVISKEVNSDGEIDWYKVRLNSDFNGWLKASDFQIIENTQEKQTD